MVTRGIIEKIVDTTHVKVRVPRINKSAGAVGATPTENLPIACIASVPGIIPYYNVSDVVYVDYENDNTDSPVVIGLISSAITNNGRSDIFSSSIQVDASAILPTDTNIGPITPESINNISLISDIINRPIGESYPAAENVSF